ncbi:hypothetical protein Prudu_010183 [Prunus dulcis]|uniref:Uncharacterized protein n=1 Tax=Prunus dulcis TaxID=3755 RepID=A0A4Y1R8B0_PRUDU|nr:hypothetical protein Prudu_010183 [Prunus dulcis]
MLANKNGGYYRARKLFLQSKTWKAFYIMFVYYIIVFIIFNALDDHSRGKPMGADKRDTLQQISTKDLKILDDDIDMRAVSLSGSLILDMYDKTRPNFRFGNRADSCACPTPGGCRAQMTFLPFSFSISFKIFLRLPPKIRQSLPYTRAISKQIYRIYKDITTGSYTLVVGRELGRWPEWFPSFFYGLGAKNKFKIYQYNSNEFTNKNE